MNNNAELSVTHGGADAPAIAADKPRQSRRVAALLHSAMFGGYAATLGAAVVFSALRGGKLPIGLGE